MIYNFSFIKNVIARCQGVKSKTKQIVRHLASQTESTSRVFGVTDTNVDRMLLNQSRESPAQRLTPGLSYNITNKKYVEHN